MSDKRIKLKGTVGAFPSLFVSDEQAAHKKLKEMRARLKAIDLEVVILENERKTISYEYFKLKAKYDRTIERQKENESTN